MKKGKFIVIYGMNNLGKTTLATRIIEHLNSLSFPASYLKYPIYDLAPTGPKINAYLREGNPENFSPFQAQSQYAQNRRDYEATLVKRLMNGEWIVAEDYTGTGLSWGVTFGLTLKELLKINEGLLEPDLALLLDGERFTDGIEKNHAHESSEELWKLGRKIHRQMAERFGWIKINANQSREEVFRAAGAAMKVFIPEIKITEVL